MKQNLKKKLRQKSKINDFYNATTRSKIQNTLIKGATHENRSRLFDRKVVHGQKTKYIVRSESKIVKPMVICSIIFYYTSLLQCSSFKKIGGEYYLI